MRAMNEKSDDLKRIIFAFFGNAFLVFVPNVSHKSLVKRQSAFQIEIFTRFVNRNLVQNYNKKMTYANLYAIFN